MRGRIRVLFGRIGLGGRARLAARIDLPGMLGFAVSMTVLVVFLTDLPHIAWIPLLVLAAAAPPTVAWELRRPAPSSDFRRPAHAPTEPRK
ncbi:hypothetical protein ACIQU6_26945 [Streptomyces sp. NPDC090442]|uniref:hypothetical protein n=1 Tax=Streptomyces sp. NPDC090442 TaxID=3365962 RepID=UPI0037FA978B